MRELQSRTAGHAQEKALAHRMKDCAPIFQGGGTGYNLVRASTAQEQVSVRNGDPFHTRMRTIIDARAKAVWADSGREAPT